MPQTSQILMTLLASLASAKRGSTLTLDRSTLALPSAAPLLELFTTLLNIGSFTLEEVHLPDSVTGTVLQVSGHDARVTLDLRFEDNGGQVSIEALFRAPAIGALRQEFPALPPGFFDGIAVSDDGTASVRVPGVVQPLTLDSASYGVVGLVTPSSGLVTMSVAPRVEGHPPDRPKTDKMLVELATATTGHRIAPLAGNWKFEDLSSLIQLFDALKEIPPIIERKNLGLRNFDLNLYPQAPGLSSISLDVADTTEPDEPLWKAAGGKVSLTDVIVTIDLTYSDDHKLSPAKSGSVRGDFVLGGVKLNAQIPFPPTGIWSLTAFPDLSLSDLGALASLVGGDNSTFKSLLPAQLADLGSFELSYLRIAVNVTSFSLVEFSFTLSSDKPWTLVPKITLGSLQIGLTIDGKPSVTGMISGTFQLPHGAGILVSLGRSTPDESWRLDVISPAIALPSIGQLTDFAGAGDLGALIKAGDLDQRGFVMTNLNLGITLSPPKLTNLGLALQLSDHPDSLSPELDWPIIQDVLRLTKFSFGFQLDLGDQPTKTVFGSFMLNDLEFDVKFASQASAGGNADGLIAEYSAQGAVSQVHLKDLIKNVSDSVADYVPDGLVIDIADAVLAYLNTDGKKKFLFAMDIAVELPISDLPLVGKALPADALVGIKNLKAVVASAALSAQDVAFINSMSAKPVLAAPAASADGAAIPAGFSMTAELELGVLSILVTSPPVPPQPKPSARRSLALARRPGGELAAAAASDPVMWIQVQKTFGPVQVQKVGFGYSGGTLSVVANLSLAVAGLEIDLLGIGIGTPIPPQPKLKFMIQGLAVSFTEGPVSILGGMLGTLDPLDFVGVLSVRAPELSLTAFAGYAQYENHPSFFLYGVLDAPIGGPPAFFVTGIAAGVGFNRKLLIPDVSGVATFPLVQWAQGNGTPSMDPSQPVRDQVGTVLTTLAKSGVVAPSVGDYWFAAGVSFTSFEIIKSFALLTVSLGASLEIALLGLATLTLPPDEPEPVAQIQLALEVAFAADKGLVAIAGQLTSSSYVLSPQARLTGGFAFYLWVSGPQAGETVLTLGGYNPSFTVPKTYPVVPRVGLNWKIVPELSVTGELYFTLTSNVVMAGGKLSAVWNSDGISAWFTYWADFLMTFSPFHYYIDGGIDLGARFTVNLAFVSLTVSIHIGVTVELWGPPFAGRATVNLSIISFTISFNDGNQPDQATSIPWPQFVQRLLPGQPAKPKARGRPAALANPAPPPAAVVQVNVTSGLVRELEPKPSGPAYLVTAETFQCAVITVIPSKKVVFGTDPDPAQRGLANLAYAPDSEQPADRDKKPITPTTDFGAGPANLSPADFQPELTLSVSSPTNSVLHAYRRFTGAPKALWENKTFDPDHGVPQVDPATGLTAPAIPDALTGLTLVPYLKRKDRTRAVPLESLLVSLDAEEPFDWSPAVPPATDPFTGQTVAATITDHRVAAVRDALLGALAGQGVSVTTTVDVSRLGSEATTDLEAAPRLRLLGGPPRAA